MKKFILLLCLISTVCSAARLEVYLKLDDDYPDHNLVDEMGGINTGGLMPQLNVVTGIATTPGRIGGAINFNNNYPVATRYVDLGYSYRELLSADYSVSYLCKASDFRGSIMAAYKATGGNLIDIATLYHCQGYWEGVVNTGTRHMFEVSAKVPAKYKNQWALFNHTVQQVGPDVRVRLLINGRAYVDKLVKDFNLAQWGASSPDKYVDLYLAAFNEGDHPREGFGCILDEVRLYSGILTDNDINSLCQSYKLAYEGPDPECAKGPLADFNDDCEVNFKNIDSACLQWLDCALVDPNDCW